VTADPTQIGFVVIGRNEGPRLGRCLRSALAVSTRVVYADSASTDGSVDTAERIGVAVVELASDGRLTAARGRNAGYKELRARFPDCEMVQFLDGDCILQPHWLPQAIDFLEEHPKVGVVCGRRFEAHPEASIYNRLCDAEWDTPIGEATECGGDALVRCAALDEVGGYRSELQAGEEPEMTARMRAAGWQIWRIDAPMTEHDARILTFGQWWRRTQRGGFGYAQVWTATSNLAQQLYSKQLRSALLWAVVLPLAIFVAAMITRTPIFLLAIPIAYGLQLMRIASRSRSQSRWPAAALILLAKFPEAIGAARFFLAGGHRHMPEYKS
jgi:cellulose synthase/poly-beta-1,6-N-acetylglucosamine synthase-like glycosyltransferase